jgi:osmoprotectant transport system permease protein
LLALVFTLLRPGAPKAQESPAESPRPVVVASKPFAESYLLAEMFAQLLEAEGVPVERRLGLGATELAFQALRNDAVDVYPEYTGTGLLAILGEPPGGDAREVWERVARAFGRRWGILWLPPLGFENTYAVAVRRETAERYGLRTLSDLRGVGERLVAGFSPDFIGREDGLPGLRQAYGIDFRAVRALLQAVKYEAIAAGRVDIIDGYSTDGAISRYDLVVLEDDRGFFPPYDAAPLVSARLARENPGALVVLARTAGRFDEAEMRGLNRRLEVDGEALTRVARLGLVRAGLAPASDTLPDRGPEVAPGEPGGAATEAGPGTPGEDREGWWSYLWTRRAALGSMTVRHLFLAGGSLAAAVLLAVPLGLLLERRRESAEGVIRAVGMLQTVPSIALLAFMIPLLGIGVVPAMVALFLYSLFPILRNTFTGVRDADPDAVGAARAVGMTPWQLLRYVRLPLAAPVIMAGIRTAAVINIGTATLAAFIGAGGLGDPIVSGLALSDTRMILSGAVPAAALALAVDALLGWTERGVTPRGLTVGGTD